MPLPPQVSPAAQVPQKTVPPQPSGTLPQSSPGGHWASGLQAQWLGMPAPPQTCPADTSPFTFPVLTYTHAIGCSITGGYVYRGCAMPDLRGTYFYSDICTGFIRTFAGVSGGVAQNQQIRTADVAPGGGLTIDGVSSFAEDARGEIYIVDYGGGADGAGEIYRIVPGS